MDGTWLVFIGLGKLPTNFQRHARSHPYINVVSRLFTKCIYGNGYSLVRCFRDVKKKIYFFFLDPQLLGVTWKDFCSSPSTFRFHPVDLSKMPLR